MEDWKLIGIIIASLGVIAGVYFAGMATSGNTSGMAVDSSIIVTIAEVVFGIIGFVVVVAGLIYGSKSLFDANSFQYASIFAMYLPVAYVMVGIISDIVAQEYKASSSSVTAIAAIIVNKLVSMIVVYLGGTTQKIQEATAVSGDITTLYTRVYQGCTVPGFEGMESIVAPQSIVIIVSLFMFFALEIGINHSGQSLSGLVWLSITALVIQLAFINTNGCLRNEYYWNGSVLLSIVIALLVGGSVGAAGWMINRTMFPVTPGSNSAGGSGGGLGSTGPVVGPPSGSVLPPVGGSTGGSSSSDDNQFVCEAYKNGELITSTIAE